MNTVDKWTAQTLTVQAADTLLTLHDRRVWNALIANSLDPKQANADCDFEMELADVRASHGGNERIEDSIERLMTAVVRWHKPDGSVSQFPLLGATNREDPQRRSGVLRYRFDRELTELVRDPFLLRKLELAVMAAFSSTYALALYEYTARRIKMAATWQVELSVAEFRAVLGVKADQLAAFSNFKQQAIVPAVREVCSWAPFTVEIAYRKAGQRVTSVVLSWAPKSRAVSPRELQTIGRPAQAGGAMETAVVFKNNGRFTAGVPTAKEG